MLRGHAGPVSVMRWSPDSKYLASADASDMHIWDVNSQKMSGTFSMPQGSYFTGMGWLPGGRQIAIAIVKQFSIIYTYDTHTWGETSLYYDSFYPSRIAWSSDGQLRAESENSKSIVIYNTAMNQLVNAQNGPNDQMDYSRSEYVLALSWSPDNKYVASGDNLGIVRAWETSSGKNIWTAQYSQAFVSALAWSPNGKYLAVASASSSDVLVCDAFTGKPVSHYASPYSIISALTWSPDSQHIALAGAGTDPVVEIWNIAPKGTISIYQGHGGEVLSLSWSPDGRYIASGGNDTTVQIWKPE